jgi:secreted trypsin-like serine protease
MQSNVSLVSFISKAVFKLAFAGLLVLLAACGANETEVPASSEIGMPGLQEGAVITSARFVVQGTLNQRERYTTLSYRLNGGDSVDVSGHFTDTGFSFELELGEAGQKTLELSAGTAAGERVTTSVSFTYLLVNPTITLSEPAPGILVTEPVITLEGSVKDDTGITALKYTLNGGAATDVLESLQGEAFRFEVPLAEAGEQKLELTALDKDGNKGQVLLTFTYATNGIVGNVYNNLNDDGFQEANEPGLEGWTVYLDKNNNRKLDASESSTKTDAEGNYVFANLRPGDYTVRQVLPFGWRNTAGGTDESALAANVAALAAYANLTFQKANKGPKIVGGVDTTITDFPFMVAVGVATSREFNQFCGGALITDSWVLTAAHCSVDEDGNASNPVPEPGVNLAVFIGSDTLSEAQRVVPVSRIIVHPKYSNVIEEGYDFALWELAKPVPLNDIYTVEMLTPELENLTADNRLATATGWGALASGAAGPDRLQVVHAPIVNPEQCFEANSQAYVIKNFDTQICAGVPEGGIDTCQGDSGGPLLVRSEDNTKWLHAGATSYGVGCAFPGFPGLYARTSVLSGWATHVATLPSRSYRVRVGRDEFVTEINFGNTATTRILTGPIEPRWQLTNLTPSTPNPAPETPLTYTWNILDEGTSTFSCTFDPDGVGVAPASNVACAEGSNSVTFAGYSQSLYLASLSVSKADLTQNRETFVTVGDPLLGTQQGELTPSDPTDPNYSSRYYIDYYRITGLSAGELALLELEPALDADGVPLFGPFIALYNAATFVPGQPNEELTSAGFQLVFRADGTADYVVGVSTGGEEEVGAYTLKLKGKTGGLEPLN